MSETTSPVAELVTFRLIKSADPQAFVAAARAIEPLLHATGQVKSRTLSCGEDGTWSDHITWTSMAAATTAANAMMADPTAAPMMQMIDPETVDMQHRTIMYQQE